MLQRPQTPVSASNASLPRSRHSTSSITTHSNRSNNNSTIGLTRPTSADPTSRLEEAVQLFQERPLVKDITPSLMSLVQAVQDVLEAGAPTGGIIFSQPSAATVLSLLSQVTLKATMEAVKEVVPSNDPEKQLQMWIVIALNEALLPTYLQVLQDNEAAQKAGWSETSPIIMANAQLIGLLNGLLERSEFQLHLEEFVEYRPVVPDVKVCGSIISRTSPSLEAPQVGLAQLSLKNSSYQVCDDDDLDSTKESPNSSTSLLLEPMPIAPPSPLIQTNRHNSSMFSAIWNRASGLFTLSPSISSTSEGTLSLCSNVESLLNIREGIICGSLLNQKFKCPQCQCNLLLQTHKFCEFSGRFYCEECFGHLESINPFRVLNNWDFTPRPLYNPLQRRVQGIVEKESFLLSEELIEAVPLLREFRDARIRLSHLFAVLLVKGKGQEAESIRARLSEHAHLVTESADVYTINDLLAIHQSRLTAQSLETIISEINSESSS